MISIIVPTYNEAGNIDILLRRLSTSLSKTIYEVIVVDDNSPDGTAQRVKELAKTGFPVHLICRKSKAGLASAVVAGLQAAQGDYIVVMDADLSHPPELLPTMIEQCEIYDLVVASRYAPGGGSTEWTLWRKLISSVACYLARPLCPMKDAMSGYFMIRRLCLEGVKFDPVGFKIGLEVFVKARYGSFIEVPYIFINRQSGESKLTSRVSWDYLKHLWRLYRWQRNDKKIRVCHSEHSANR